MGHPIYSLNPYYSGRGFQRRMELILKKLKSVLILIIVEEGFREIVPLTIWSETSVLILIIVEEGFRGQTSMKWLIGQMSLNPYYSGRGFQRLLYSRLDLVKVS